jgi:hypothetical protein
MTAKDERSPGVEILTEILSGGRILRVKRTTHFSQRPFLLLRVTAYRPLSVPKVLPERGAKSQVLRAGSWEI